MSKQTELECLQKNSKTPIIVSNGVKKAPTAKPLGERRKAVLRQELMVFLGNTGVLGGGMAVAIPSVTLGQLTNPLETFVLGSDESSWFSSINTMACPLGGLLVGYLMDRIGRKNTIIFTNIVGVLGWAFLAAAPLHTDRNATYVQMLIGRFLSGIMIGLCVSPVGVYSAEISLPKIRGRLIMGTSIGIAAGILFMYILGYFIRNDWQLISIISCIYQIISTICVFPIPESPSWLMQKGRVEQARKSLKYFRGLNKEDLTIYDEFETELAQIKKTADLSRSTAETESVFQAIKSPEVYKPLLVMIAFFAFQQWSGIVVVIVYAVQIATRAGVSTDPVLCAVLVGLARIITTFFMSSIFEKWGRRPAGIVSAFGMSACMLILASCGWFGIPLPILPVICIVLHIVFSTMGLLTLPFFMTSEVFPQRVRGSASGLTVSFGLLVSFLVLKLYPTMETSMGTANVFAFYGFVSLIGVAYIYYFVPETRGRTLLEIENYFRTGRKVSNAEVALRAITVDAVEMNEVFIIKENSDKSEECS
ncbi:facilitated trehalose transporter Tret1-2 homolog [Teleopsis dalmanni]|uniref:facilitated trehalose transporter Tret1-2 homolog n=1 Tax=Teleopsis dalmanni TaxID=139649 RepID=UPI0018CE24A0|nr:facilitated trehalose transporter Tret1-2 homolog [Teleopsis dalmanni]XP_037948100.1 facilitated trehalose transporter Tret1-2 homolog [Teleopsis dalmanni]